MGNVKEGTGTPQRVSGLSDQIVYLSRDQRVIVYAGTQGIHQEEYIPQFGWVDADCEEWLDGIDRLIVNAQEAFARLDGGA